MTLGHLWNRCKGRYRRIAAARLAKRPFILRNRKPIISFTFDDFPISALHVAGRILEDEGVRGTYYTSLGLMGKVAPTGEMFREEDVAAVVQRGHELGCHTFAHCHAFETSPAVFEENILENRRALEALVPGTHFETHSYPISCPRPGTKKRCATHFLGSRAGGQTYNHGTVDLENLQAFFLEQSRDDLGAIQAIIDGNQKAAGWLIFATHDVTEEPTRYGCTPKLFSDVVRHAIRSGAEVLPVSAALRISGMTVGT